MARAPDEITEYVSRHLPGVTLTGVIIMTLRPSPASEKMALPSYDSTGWLEWHINPCEATCAPEVIEDE